LAAANKCDNFFLMDGIYIWDFEGILKRNISVVYEEEEEN
jgi:hypothetical protein